MAKTDVTAGVAAIMPLVAEKVVSPPARPTSTETEALLWFLREVDLAGVRASLSLGPRDGYLVRLRRKRASALVGPGALAQAGQDAISRLAKANAGPRQILVIEPDECDLVEWHDEDGLLTLYFSGTPCVEFRKLLAKTFPGCMIVVSGHGRRG